MPLAFVAALAASLGIHLTALFGTDVDLFGGPDEPVTLQAELQPPPPAAAKAADKPVAKAKPRATRPGPVPVPSSATPQAEALAATEPVAPEITETTPVAPEPVKPLLPARGTIRFVIYYGTQEFQIGRAEHSWEFSEDGRYRLSGMTETSGLAALIKSVRFENESSGRLVAGGLQPEHYWARKNGKDTNERADFDWATGEVHLAKNNSVQPLTPGAQDFLSLNYQLAYLPRPEAGTTVGVVAGRHVKHYALEALGEESLQTPAGAFRTLHLRTVADTVTEIWIALDYQRLPVKIRYTDKKGDVFEQVATELGTMPTASSSTALPYDGAPAASGSPAGK